MAEQTTFKPEEVRPAFVPKTQFTVDELNAAMAPQPDPNKVGDSIKAFGKQALEMGGKVSESAAELVKDPRTGRMVEKPILGLTDPGGPPSLADEAIIGAGKALVGGLHSLGEMAVSGLQALFTTAPGKDYAGRFQASVEAQEPQNKAARELAQKIAHVNLAPEGKTDEAMAELVGLLPGAVHAAGGTAYEATGSAIVGAGTEALGTFLMLKPEVVSKALAPLKGKGAKPRVEPEFPLEDQPPPAEPGTAVTTPPKPKGPPPSGGGTPPPPKGEKAPAGPFGYTDVVDAAFTEAAVKNPALVTALADHVREADPGLAVALEKKVVQASVATPQQVKEQGKEAAKREMTGEIEPRGSGRAIGEIFKGHPSGTYVTLKASDRAAAERIGWETVIEDIEGNQPVTRMVWKGKGKPKLPATIPAFNADQLTDQILSRPGEREAVDRQHQENRARILKARPEDAPFITLSAEPRGGTGMDAHGNYLQDLWKEMDEKARPSLEDEDFPFKVADANKLIYHATHTDGMHFFVANERIGSQKEVVSAIRNFVSKHKIKELVVLEYEADGSTKQLEITPTKTRAIDLEATKRHREQFEPGGGAAHGKVSDLASEAAGREFAQEVKAVLADAKAGRVLLVSPAVGSKLSMVEKALKDGKMVIYTKDGGKTLDEVYRAEDIKDIHNESIYIVEGMPHAGEPAVPPFLEGVSKVPLKDSIREGNKAATKAKLSTVEGSKGKTGTGHVIGKRYRSDYWREEYDVLGPSEQYPSGVRVHYLKDDRIVEHLTPVGKDKIVGDAAKDLTAEKPLEYPTLVEKAETGLSNAAADVSKAAEQPSPEDAPKPGMEDPTVFLNAGIPITASQIKAAFDFTKKYVPGVEFAAGKIEQYWEGLLRVFSPESIGPEAKRAGAIIASAVADSGLNEAMLYGPASQKRRTFWNYHADIIPDFVRTFESGGKFADPLVQRAAEGYKTWSKKIYEAEKGLGFTYDALDNYLYHVFKDGPKVQKHFEQRYGVKWGDPNFIKDRTFNLYDEAIKAGYTPRFTNPEDIMQARQRAHEVAKGRIRILAELAQHGLAIPVTKGSHSPQGFAPTPRRAPNGDMFWVHQQADNILVNLWDSKSLWSMENFGGDVFRGVMWLKNSMTPIILSFSAFHALHVLTIDNVTGIVRATKELMAGAETPASWLGRSVKGLLYLDLIENPTMGGKINKIVKGKVPRSQWTEADITALRYMMEGGFVPLMPHVYKTGAIKNFKDAFEIAVGATRRGEIPSAAKKLGQAAWHLPFAVTQMIQKPMFEVWIPNLKTASYLRDVATALKADPTLLGDVGRRKETFRKIAKSVDNRYGEMAYNTLFWKNWVKDIGVGASLSLGWNLGFLREYGGAAIDLGKIGVESSTIGGGGGKKGGGGGKKGSGSFKPSEPPKGVGSAAKRGDLDRALFTTIYTATSLATGLLMTHLLRDDDDKEETTPLDAVYPKVGGKNPDGTPKRVSTMFYAREFYSIYKHTQTEGIVGGLTDLVANKAAPSIGLVKSWATGVDEFDREIWDPNAPTLVKVQQALKHSLGELEPISVATINANLKNDPKTVALAIAGFSPAPKYATATKTEGLIRHTFQKYYGAKQTPYEKVAYSEDSQRLRRLYESGDMTGYSEALGEIETKHELTRHEMNRLQDSVEGGEDPVLKMFSRLDWHLQKHIMDQMTPEELDVYIPISNKEHLRNNYIPPERK